MMLRQNSAKQKSKQRASKHAREHDQANCNRTHVGLSAAPLIHVCASVATPDLKPESATGLRTDPSFGGNLKRVLRTRHAPLDRCQLLTRPSTPATRLLRL